MLHMPIEIDGEDYLTAGEAADYLGVSPTTFVKFQREFRLKAYTRAGAGQRKFFRKRDLDPIKQYKPLDQGDDQQ